MEKKMMSIERYIDRRLIGVSAAHGPTRKAQIFQTDNLVEGISHVGERRDEKPTMGSGGGGR